MKASSSIKILALLVAGTASTAASAQEGTWTLDRCIEYAKTNNIQVKSAQLNKESADISLMESKSKVLPSLQFSTSQNATNKKTPNMIDGTYSSSKLSYSGNYSLSSSTTLYNGGKVRNNIKQQEISLKRSDTQLLVAQNSIEASVTQAYIQVLFANESLKSSKKTLESSEATLNRSKELLAAGSLSKSDYAQLESQYSNDKYQVTMSENDLAQAKLTLKQLLELGIGENIELNIPEISDQEVLTILPSLTDVYQIALASRPEIQSSKYELENSQLDVQIAQAGKLPTVTLSASAGTGSSLPSDFATFNQLNNGFNQSVGITVGIPIFSNRSVRSNIQRSNISVKQAELNYSSAEKDLLKTVENLYLDAKSGQAKYLAAKDKLTSAKMSYDLVQAQFNEGMKNTVELLTEMNNYTNAEAGFIQAKYQSVLSIKLLNFYQNQPITL